jgi:hypothetical protein
MNLAVLGLIFDILGVFIITITEIINPFHGRKEDLKWWDKEKYWWMGWRPFYKNTQTHKWVTKWNHKPVVYGIIPPKYVLEMLGLLFILIGFVLQLIVYFK